jgi:PAS domain S-box-containing protein
MYVYNPQTAAFLEVNDAACALYGYTREELLALHVTDIHPPDKIARMQEVMRSGIDPFVKLRNWKHRNKAGHTIEVDTYSRALGFGPLSARLVVVVDVTERNAAEAQLRQAQKMEAIGQITGGVAHDFNNLLTIIVGNLELIAEKCGDNEEMRAMTADALSSAQRGASLTQRLLAFARQQPLEPRLIQLEHLITDMAGLLGRSLGETIHIRQFLAPGLWNICVDAAQLENALLNLAVNARDAMPHGGDLTIEAQNVVLDETLVRDHPDATPGEYVQLAVTDTGTGIAPGVLEHILEPFFTTKPVGKGTGLGLSMVYGLVRQSGGHLEIESEPGHGATIRLFLPRALGEATPAEPIQLDPMPRSAHGETVLIVEDDATIRKLVERLLSMLGYKVLSAGDATAALDLLETADAVDLLFTDIILPNGMSGAALAREAQLRHPALKLLYMSGYTRNALPQTPGDTAHLLLKPFRKEDLARAIHRALNA